VIVGMQITSINETAGFTYCRIVYEGCATFITEGPNAIEQIRPRAAPSFHRLSSTSGRRKNPLCCIAFDPRAAG